MVTEEPQSNGKGTATTEPAPAISDYLASPNAVFKDEGVQWRYGRAPDYSKTRKVWEEGKRMNHAAGSLEEMVENLVKNWEVEASFKPRLSDWRTIDHEKYSFAMGGGEPQSAEHMIKVGTYNGIIAPNEYYSPENSDFASSHKTFKRMMPTFAWEVLEVYSGPPRVAFRWRHWGYMKNDYVGFNDKGEKVIAKAHGGIIDIEGVTVAEVDDKVRLRAIQTWMDPLEMFRQIAPKGVVNRVAMDRNVEREVALDDATSVNDGEVVAEQRNGKGEHVGDAAPGEVVEKNISASTGVVADEVVPHQGTSEQDNGSTNGTAKEQNANGAKAIIETAASQGAAMDIDTPPSNYHDTTQHLSADQVPSSEHQPTADPLDPRMTKAAKLEPPTAHDAIDAHLEQPASQVHPQPKDAEVNVSPAAGEAVVAATGSEETRLTQEEMSRLSPGECPFLMNRE
ncbi:hypothetical protein M409DRAFT_17627 [Zasmidium cellare ATCC 36951]|uniref:Pathogen-related protein n=1 Tax=Zasmidium cellare ATCC 36951 TaxID=1080233 RepID=A0A6A6D054_ZASCE|nr:uncharacterized protein M409DRAFT_17627 [Zasmidium cellare ATCC 36951]KAF2172393.1 hypothetical protein M409DRAFT_17627 [Zasmidium cellare ATCC 36951]